MTRKVNELGRDAGNGGGRMSEQDTGVVLGIDVGWSENKKTTGVCLLDWSPTTVRLRCHRLPARPEKMRKEFETLLKGQRVVTAAIDGPLRGTLDGIGRYRFAERMLTLGFQFHIGKPGQASSGNGKQLNRAANAVTSMLLALDIIGPASHRAKISQYAIVEAFPTSFLGVLLPDGCSPSHGSRSDAYFEHLLGPDCPAPPRPTTNQLAELLRRLFPAREFDARLGDITDHEERAAAICAITAACVAVRQYVAVGDPTDGYIILPPVADSERAGMQPWAWEILQKNCPAGQSDSLLREPREPEGQQPTTQHG